MKTIKGDLIKLALDGEFDVIVHGCNCFTNMGAGIAVQIRRTFPEAWKVDADTIPGDKEKMGTYTKATIQRGFVIFDVVNAYTQYGCNAKFINVDYAAIRSVMQSIKQDYAGKRIGLPLIGCGLAKGDWNIVSKIIQEELDGEDVTIVEFDQQLGDIL